MKITDDYFGDENLDSLYNKVAANIIKRYREMAGLSLEEVSSKMKNSVSRQMLFKYENNLSRMKISVFNDICRVLKQDPSEVWQEINEIALGENLRQIKDRIIKFDNGDFILTNDDTIKIPVLGVIKAGTPIEAQQDILEYIDIPKSWTLGDKHFFALAISGDSMYPKYNEKDIVIFEQTNDKEMANGKDCAVMVNGYDATFKNVTITDIGIQLTPFNPNNSDGYMPTFYNREQIESLPVSIIGIAREKRTRL